MSYAGPINRVGSLPAGAASSLSNYDSRDKPADWDKVNRPIELSPGPSFDYPPNSGPGQSAQPRRSPKQQRDVALGAVSVGAVVGYLAGIPWYALVAGGVVSYVALKDAGFGVEVPEPADDVRKVGFYGK